MVAYADSSSRSANSNGRVVSAVIRDPPQSAMQLIFKVPLLLMSILLLASRLAIASPPMIFQHLGSEAGLPQNTVMQTLQDSQGFIWIATEDGLVRYDGYELRRYAHEHGKNASLPGNFVWAMQEDKGGDLWVALKNAGLARWNRRTDRFTSFRHDPAQLNGLSSDALRALIIDRRGHLWIGTTGSGLDEFDPVTSSFRHYAHDAARPDSLSSDVVTSLSEEADGQIWVGTDDGLNRLIPASGTFEQYRSEPGNRRSLSSSKVSVIRADRRGRLWIGTYDAGLNLLDRESKSFSVYRQGSGASGGLASNEVRALLEDNDGRLWVGTAAGLNLRDERTDRFARYLQDTGDPTTLPDNYVMSLFQDRGGLLWVGTRAGGVSRWNPRTWSMGHQRLAALKGAFVNAFADDPGGHIWIGTFKGLVRFDPASGAALRLDELDGPGHRLADPRVMSLAVDRRNDLWIGTMSGGLSRRRGGGQLDHWRANATDAAALGADGIMSIIEHSNGRIWLGTFGAGVNILDPVSGRIQRVPHDTHDARSLSSPRATALAEDHDGNVWVGTDGGGVNVLRPDGTVAAVFQHRAGDPASLGANTVYALHVDPRGRVWIGTDGGGLDLVIGSVANPRQLRFRNYSQRDGLTSEVIYGIESDQRGGLWLSGNAGLVRFDPAAGVARPYHREHGLQGEEFNFGAHFRTRGGLLAFGGSNGFNLFDPRRANEKAVPPSVVLTNVEVLNKPAITAKPYPSLDRLELGYRDTIVSFEFAALDYAAPNQNRYAYRLRGFDQDWVLLRHRRAVSYTNLDPGSYLLEVKAATSDGVWGPAALSLPIVMAPAPWRTLWADAIYAAALGLLLYGWHLVQRHRLAQVAEYGRRLETEVADRTNELRERNAELDRVNQVKSDFMARMSHEIRSPMNGVIGTLELLQRTPQSAQQSKLATTARASAQSLLRILNDILDLAKVEAGKMGLELESFDLCALIEQTAQLLAPQAEAKQLELIVAVAPELDYLVVGDALRIQQLLTNLIGNAIKFTDRGEVVVCAAGGDSGASDQEITISVRDSGIGMTREALARVFEPFAQADESTTRRFGGTGLGLAICRELAALMNASISVESEPGRGSVFTLQLRLPRGNPNARPDAGNLAGRRALIASGRPALLAAIVNHARAWGLTLETVASGAELAGRLAEAAADLKAPRIDAVIVDADSLPEEAAALAPGRAQPGWPPVVFLCSGDAPLRVRSSAPTTLVGKPVQRAELHEALLRALGRETKPRVASLRSGGVRRLPAHVLVADDNPVNQTVAEGFLIEMGCTVTCVGDGRAAVTRASSGAFDLILMDLQMPDIDGIAATTMIRRAEAAAGGRRTPIIALTANASATHRKDCLAANMDDFLGKPLYLEDLREVLQRWMPGHIYAPESPRPAVRLAAEPAELRTPLDAEMIAGIRSISRPGQASLFTRLVGLFASSGPRQLGELHAALARGDLGAAAAVCHALKGGAGNVGAATFAHTAGELRIACTAGDQAAIASLLAQLDGLLPAAISALQAEALKESA
jgi:signal transduction histidine kinase/ligand-binding sensor domain-containing protein/CheY-like chemotaxis protein/HPt (histidine-containing phosphotransfer) domain-containing protein